MKALMYAGIVVLTCGIASAVVHPLAGVALQIVGSVAAFLIASQAQKSPDATDPRGW